MRGVELPRDAPQVSPLYAELGGLPRALFSCGTKDPLLDDSTFMAARWAAAGNEACLKLWPGGAHGVGHFGPHEETELGRQARAFIEDWMQRAPSGSFT